MAKLPRPTGKDLIAALGKPTPPWSNRDDLGRFSRSEELMEE